MTGLMAKLRGLLGLSTVGAIIGGAFGALWEIAGNIFGLPGIGFGTVAWSAGLWAGFGAVAAGGVGVILATIGAGSRLEELSPWKAALGGAFVGAMAPVALVFAVTGGFSVYGIGLVTGLSAGLGGVLGAGLVGTAKRAQRAELRQGKGQDALGPGA